MRQPTPKTTQAVNMNVDRIYRFFGKPCDFNVFVINGGNSKLTKLQHETEKAKAFGILPNSQTVKLAEQKADCSATIDVIYFHQFVKLLDTMA